MKKIPWKVVLADLAVAAALVPVVLPQLADAPGWVRTALTIFALVVARFNGTDGSSRAGYRPTLPPAAGVVLLVAALALGAASSCGGASAATRTAYAAEVVHCADNEHEIVRRPGTTAAQDQHDLDVERARCDAALRAIEQNGGR